MNQALLPTTPTAAASDFKARLDATIDSQRAAYSAAGFPSAAVRIERLERTIAMLIAHQDAIVDALALDFGHRSREETLFADVLGVIEGLRHAASHVTEWMAAQTSSPTTSPKRSRSAASARPAWALTTATPAF